MRRPPKKGWCAIEIKKLQNSCKALKIDSAERKDFFYTLKGLRFSVIPFCAQKSVFDFACRMINACFCMPGYQGALAAQADFARLGKARLLRIYPQVLNQLLFALESQQHAAESSFSGGKNSSTGNSMPRKVSHGFCVLHSHSLSGMQ